MSVDSSKPKAVAVYCASSLGHQKAFQHAALSVAHALAESQRPLVYGGGSMGIMGLVSQAVLDAGGDVVGVVPYAMVAGGGEGEKSTESQSTNQNIELRDRTKVQTILVDSMHERKLEMAKRSCGFIGLPGGYGTFEEVFEVVTWTQLGIHNKPVVLLNVLQYYNPLREMIRNGIREGFIEPRNERLVCFVDGPSDLQEHVNFDWGRAALDAIVQWGDDGVERMPRFARFDWTLRKNGQITDDRMGAA